jgi:hypothetical protein
MNKLLARPFLRVPCVIHMIGLICMTRVTAMRVVPVHCGHLLLHGFHHYIKIFISFPIFPIKKLFPPKKKLYLMKFGFSKNWLM